MIYILRKDGVKKEMTDKGNNLEFPFMTDEKIDKMLDDVVASVGEMIVEQESKPSIINPQKLREVCIAYNALKFLTKGTSTKVTYNHDEFPSVGTVSIIGKKVTFNNSEWFVRACNLASNIDVYPRTDNTIRLDLTFYDLTRLIG